MTMNDSHDSAPPLPSRASEQALGAVWTIVGLLWLAAGGMALTASAPAPVFYNFVLTAASGLLVVATFVTLFHDSRRRHGKALARIHERLDEMCAQQRQRDEAWATINALLEPTGSNLRVLRTNTGPH